MQASQVHFRCALFRLAAPAPTMLALLGMLLAAAGTAHASDAAPAPAHEAELPAEATPSDSATYPVRPWLQPALLVRGMRTSPLREEDRIGDYAQPRWTAQRLFPTTRVYVVPAGKVAIEYWNRWNAPLSRNFLDQRKIQSMYEIEFGLGHRLQLDLYLVTEQDGWKGALQLQKEKIELRWALADWGRIWGNPTLYVEWSREAASPDFVEAKLLLGGKLATGWHAGANLLLERKLGDNRSHEYGITAGVARTLVDEVLSLGLEAKTSLLDAAGRRGRFGEQQYLVGPSLSYFPLPPMHLLVTLLAGAARQDGLTDGVWESWVIAGWTL